MQVSLPDPTAPNVGGVPHSHNFFHPHFSNHANVLPMSDTFNIGVNPLASIRKAGYHCRLWLQALGSCRSALGSGFHAEGLNPIPGAWSRGPKAQRLKPS